MPVDEFDAIRTCSRRWRPIRARGLKDDVAVLELGAAVITTDAIVEGVHFLPDDPIATVAMKAVRVNVSISSPRAQSRWARLSR